MSTYRPKQVWAYRTRPGEESSRALVLHVEEFPNASVIVHVGVYRLRIHNPAAPSGVTEYIAHAPLTETSFAGSVTEFEGDIEDLPDFEFGYSEWRQAFEAGQGGVWTVPLSEIVQAIEDGLNDSESRIPQISG